MISPEAKDAHGDDSAPRPMLVTRIRRVALASAAAQGIGEVISLVQTIVVARLLTPVEVGVFAAGTVLTTFLAEFSEGGLRPALINREDDVEEAAVTVFWATLLAGIGMSLGALAAAPLVGAVFNDRTAGLVAAASSGGLVLYSLANVPEALLQREFNVRRRLIVGPAVAASFAGVTITMAAQGFGVWSLVAGTYASYLCLVIAVWTLCGWRPGRARASVRLWRELAAFGFPLVLGSVVAKLQHLVETTIVGRRLDTVSLGYYRYSLRIARIPTNAIIEIVGYALFPAFARIATDAVRMRDAYVRTLTWVTLCAAPMSGLLAAIGEPTVVVVLGEPWRGAGVAVVAMAGLGVGKAFSSVSEEAVKACGRTSLINRFTALEAVLGLSLLFLLAIPLGLIGVGLAISLTALLVGLQCVVVARRVVDAPPRQIVRAILPPLVAATAAAVPTGALEMFVLRSDTHSLPVALAFLSVDGLCYLAVYVMGIAVLAPSTLADVLRTARWRRGQRVSDTS